MTTKSKIANEPTEVGIPAAAPSPPGPRSAGSPPLILVVDDFEDNRAMYAEYLAFSGYDVAQASNGLEAVEKATALLPDIVVMDLSLPVMDGWEATRRLKTAERTKDIPVLALTGHALAGHSQGAKEAGCDDFLAKPCLPETLVQKVEAHLAAKRAAVKRDAK